KANMDGRKATIEAGKDFLMKYAACAEAKELVDYVKQYLPGMETKFIADKKKAEQLGLYTRFDTSVKSSNFADTYVSGKEILAKEPDQLDVMIVLGSIGYDEAFAGRNQFNDDTLRYAKQAIAAIEGGKTTPKFGLLRFTYNTKENALGWLNYTIGYLTHVAQKNKKDALPYLYKATLVTSDTKKNPIPYELIGAYYFDELNKITEEIKVLAADQKDTDTAEVAKQKVDTIKAKVALANGLAERAMDAFSRAYSLTDSTPKAAVYKAKMKKNVQDAYKLRFAKEDGVDAWIASAMTKPMPDPMSPVTPISDPEPVVTSTGGTALGVGTGSGVGRANGTGTGTANGAGVGNANGTGVGGAKPSSTTPAKPTAAPAKPVGAARVTRPRTN
ncbi:MAG TPA: hypothetical protein VNA17_06100, partial [Pyrinomonadaceae bacterium]|nr:hypothetical protein [Pyrinomonadaceae bacterium]